MAHAANALQKAIFQTLAGDADLAAMLGTHGVVDHRVTGKPMPYLVIAEIASSDFGPDAEEHQLTIEAWSDTSGRLEVQTIAACVLDLLDEMTTPLDGAMLVNLQHRTTRVYREPKTAALRAEMRFRAVTE